MLPFYARRYQAEWRRYDRHLRLRWSHDYYGLFVLERKAPYQMQWPEGLIQRGTDRAQQLNDGYRLVARIEPRHIHLVKDMLQACDIQAHGGADGVARMLQEREDAETKLQATRQHGWSEDRASEMYDRLAWKEGRRISMSGRTNAA